MAKILIVEDNQGTNKAICEYMKEAGHTLFSAFTGSEALKIFREKELDIIVLDIMLPEMSGIVVLHEIRKISNIPVIMLTALDDEYTQSNSFDEMADDYITKPFSMLILGKRITALLRRSQNKPAVNTVKLGDITVDFSGYTASDENGKIDITPKELEILKVLIDNKGLVLSRNQILDEVWGYDCDVIDRTIDAYIRNIRKKLRLDCITTVKGIATDINNLYQSLLLTIRNLELEKEKVSLAEKEKIDFLRTASHELKTPVTELNATLENMILGIGEYRDYETYLPKCKEITEQLGDMIRDILNASRLQTQGNNEPCSNFSLRTLLTELCEPYRLIAEAKGIKFKIELSSDAFVYLPEGRLKKAISNILSNAVNYTEAGQSISVVFDKNKLSVSNECSVLPPEQLQHIFEPFYRPDLAHSQATGGNGLGLYIVQTILDKLRLKYQFVPMPNDRGMSFTIQF